MLGNISKHLVARVDQPTSLFRTQRDVPLKDMSELELMAELDKRGWERCEDRTNARQTCPFSVVSQAPRVWYAHPNAGVPYKEYLLALLTGGTLRLKQVFHHQCKSYYIALLRLGPDAKLQPHQVAQYYKALMARRHRYGDGSPSPSRLKAKRKAQVRAQELDVDLEAAAAAQAQGIEAPSSSQPKSGPGVAGVSAKRKSKQRRQPKSKASRASDSKATVFAIDDDDADEVFENLIDSSTGESSDSSSEATTPTPAPQPTAVDSVVDLPHAEPDPQPALDLEPRPIIPALEAREAPRDVELQVVRFEPAHKSRGHETICNTLLPLLLSLMKEESWKAAEPRACVREALKRHLSCPKSKS